jgi:trehalose 6-phosphate synthase/phosphatase
MNANRGYQFPCSSAADIMNNDFLLKRYRHSCNRLFVLDYDGTLMPFMDNPDMVIPDDEIVAILNELALDLKNNVALVSGRTKEFLDKYFSDIPVILVAEHGLWIRFYKSEWIRTSNSNPEWFDDVLKIMETFSAVTAGSFVERKTSSLAFHYRNCDPMVAERSVSEIKNAIALTIKSGISILEGDKVLEVKNSDVDKGIAVTRLLNLVEYDFILACGDDATDEDTFAILPDHAYTLKIGKGSTLAKYRLCFFTDVRALLKSLTVHENDGGAI